MRANLRACSRWAGKTVVVVLFASTSLAGPGRASPFLPGVEGRSWRLEARHARPWPGLELREDRLALRLARAAGPALELRLGQRQAGGWREQRASVGIVAEPGRGAGFALRLGGCRASWAGREELRAAELGLAARWSAGRWWVGGELELRPGWPDSRPGRRVWGAWTAGEGALRVERAAARWGGGPRWRSAWVHPVGRARLGLELGPGEGAVLLGARHRSVELGLRWELLGPRAGGSELGLRWSP